MKNRYYLFASYSSKDQRIKDITQMLAENGVEVWIDQNDIKAGDMWDEDVKKAISSKYCKGILLFLSENSITSSAVYEELAFAESNFVRLTHGGDALPIIPIDLEEIMDDPMAWAYKVLEKLEDDKTKDENWYQKQELLVKNAELNYFSDRTVRIKYKSGLEELVNRIIQTVRDGVPSVLYEDDILSNKMLKEITSIIEEFNTSGKYYDALNRLKKENEKYNGDQRIKNLIKMQEQFVENSRIIKIDSNNDQINLATRKWKIENNSKKAEELFKQVIKNAIEKEIKYSAIESLLRLYIEVGYIETALETLLDNKKYFDVNADIASRKKYLKMLSGFLRYEATMFKAQKELEKEIQLLQEEIYKRDKFINNKKGNINLKKQEKMRLDAMIIQFYRGLFKSYLMTERENKIRNAYNELYKRIEVLTSVDVGRKNTMDSITNELVDYYCNKGNSSDALKMLDNIYDERLRQELSEKIEELDDGLSDVEGIVVAGNENDE